MMVEQFEFTEGPARAGVSSWEQVSDKLTSVADGVAGLTGSPWSNDQIGSAFAGKFDPNRSQAIKNAQQLADTVKTFAPTLAGAIEAIKTQSSNQSQ